MKLFNHLEQFRTKHWVEINDQLHRTYNTYSQIKFKATMFKSSLCDCGDAYILVKKTISVIGQGTITAAVATDRNNKKVLFKNCAPFTDCIS